MKLIIRTRREISFIQLLLSLRVRSVFFFLEGGGSAGARGVHLRGQLEWKKALQAIK